MVRYNNAVVTILEETPVIEEVPVPEPIPETPAEEEVETPVEEISSSESKDNNPSDEENGENPTLSNNIETGDTMIDFQNDSFYDEFDYLIIDKRKKLIYN